MNRFADKYACDQLKGKVDVINKLKNDLKLNTILEIVGSIPLKRDRH